MKLSKLLAIFKHKKITVATPIEHGLIFSYRFLDASVPPKWHRSFTIKVSPEKVEFSVDIYGTVLTRHDFPMKIAGFQAFTNALLALNLKENKTSLADHPVGGKIHHLTVMDGAGNKLEGKIYDGAGARFNTLEGDTSTAITLFKNLVPKLEKKLK